MAIVKHRFWQESFFKPDWEIKYLFLGTFNPSGGGTANYYYGRDRNQTWPLLSEIFKDELNPACLDTFLAKIKTQGIACLDLINSVEADDAQYEFIIGKGYKDSKIINRKVLREYNTDTIKKMISRNPGIKVFSTWGKGPTLKEWKNEIAKISHITPLVSPSLAAKVPKNINKYSYMLEDWRGKIIVSNS